jgi:hypothetical protein
MSKCLRCESAMTWTEQRKQYGRLMRAGKPARDISPRCQKCVTLYLGTIREGGHKPRPVTLQIGDISEISDIWNLPTATPRNIRNRV